MVGAATVLFNPVNPLEHEGKTLFWRETGGIIGGGGAVFAGQVKGTFPTGAFWIEPEGLKVKYDGKPWKEVSKNAKNYAPPDAKFYLEEAHIPTPRAG